MTKPQPSFDQNHPKRVLVTDTSFTYTCQPEETLQLREESRMKRESGAQNTASGDAASEPEPLFLQLDQVFWGGVVQHEVFGWRC